MLKPEQEIFCSVYPVQAQNARDVEAAARRIGTDPRALRYVLPKRRVLCFFAPSVDYRAAAFIKQELLSRGGEAVVAKHVIDGKTERSGVLVMATDSQLFRLVQKLEAMDCWGLKEFRTALVRAVKNEAVREWTLPLPRGRRLTLNDRTIIMGILNLTPDSFHAPSRVTDESDLLRRAEAMLEEGAGILDIGAESTRPGAAPVSQDEELERLIPALRALRRAFPDAVLSVDTRRGQTALAAAQEGADMINDIGGFGLDEEMLGCVAKTELPYVLTHIQGTPADMQNVPEPEDLLTGLHVYFQEKLRALEDAGVSPGRVIIDPGIGFGKRGHGNLLIIKEIESLRAFGRPVLIGHSRKKFTGMATGKTTGTQTGTEDRLHATTAISALLEGRAQIVRVHDVGPNRQALLMARAVREAELWQC